jgi:large subunit ribosomal protein L23
MSLGKEYDIIIKTLTTEKTARAVAESKFFFEVVSSANKDDVKNAVEKIFDVVVKSVNIINNDGKIKKFKGNVGKRNSSKKAIVTVKKGQDINFGKLE